MKRLLKKTAAALASGAIAISSTATAAAAYLPGKPSFDGKVNALPKAGISLSAPKLAKPFEDGAAGLRFATNYSPAKSVPEETAADLPASFDLRKERSVTSVKNQGQYGSCWTHSSIASAETSVIELDPSVDLSEMHTAYFTYCGSDQLGLRGVTMEDMLDRGGAAYLVANLWAQWRGPIREEKLPYGDFFFANDYSKLYKFDKDADYHLRDAVLLDYDHDKTNRDEVNAILKSLIYDGEAVDVSYFSDNGLYYDYTHDTTYTTRPATFSNHAVTIIGWDDDLPASYFRVKPPGDGAWLCKNSWGPNYGDEGFLWISYYDESLSGFAAYYLDDKDNYSTIYQHDSFAPTQSMSAFDDEEQNGKQYIASVFTPEEDQDIKAVSVYATSPDTEYEAFVYANLKDPNDPFSGELVSSSSGTMSLTGYHTLSFETPARVKKGEKFAAVVSLYNEDTPFILPMESAIYVIDDTNGAFESVSKDVYKLLIEQNTNEGETFFSADGEKWNDLFMETYTYDEEGEQALLEAIREQLYDGLLETDTELLANAEASAAKYEELFAAGTVHVRFGNFSLKAFGDPVGKTEFSHDSGMVKPDEKVSVSAPGGGDIFVSVNGDPPEEYSEPIAITEKTSLGAYAGDGPYSSREYRPAAAVLGDVFYDTSDGESYRQAVKKAVKVGENRFEIELQSYENGIKLYPVAAGDVVINGDPDALYKYGERIPLSTGENVLEWKLERPGVLDGTATIIIKKSPVHIDLEKETLSYTGADDVWDKEGNRIANGAYVGDLAGTMLTVEADGSSYEWPVPERISLEGLKIDYLTETLCYIPNDVAELLEFAAAVDPPEEAYLEASDTCRLVDGSWINSGMTMNKAFKIIPGETIFLRSKPGLGKFRATPVKYAIPETEECSGELPTLEYRDGKFYFNAQDYEAVLMNESDYSNLEYYKGYDWGYRGYAYFFEIIENKYGGYICSVTIGNNIAWASECEIPVGAHYYVRKRATETSFASKAIYVGGRELGDVDGDGSVDGSDATLVLKYYGSAQHSPDNSVIDEAGLLYADMDRDGVVDGSDATLVLQYYAWQMAYNPWRKYGYEDDEYEEKKDIYGDYDENGDYEYDEEYYDEYGDAQY